MGQNPDSVTRFLPLSAQDFQVLLILRNQPLHGYGIVLASEDHFDSEPALEIGSLYRIIARLLDQGLIREVKQKTSPQSDGRKRRFYQTSALGLEVARAEATRLKAMLNSRPAMDLMEGR